MHGLRATMITLLQDSGLSDSAIALHTDHRDPNSLKKYTNLQGRHGQQQIRAIFRDSSKPGAAYMPKVITPAKAGVNRKASSSSSIPLNLGLNSINEPQGNVTINVYNNVLMK